MKITVESGDTKFAVENDHPEGLGVEELEDVLTGFLSGAQLLPMRSVVKILSPEEVEKLDS
jgi:hypothetical protein